MNYFRSTGTLKDLNLLALVTVVDAVGVGVTVTVAAGPGVTIEKVTSGPQSFCVLGVEPTDKA